MGFMVPVAEYFTAAEAGEYVEWDRDLDDAPEAGWYSRLTAPGFVDSTGWMGPYPNCFRALRDVCRTFDVDLKGNDRSGW